MNVLMKGKVMSLFLIFAIAPLLGAATNDSKSNNINSVRAVVDDEIITQEEVIKHASVAIREAQGKYQDKELMDKIDELLKDTLDELINRKVLIKEAHRLFGTDEARMKEVEKELNSFVKGAVKNVGSLSRYYEIAESQGINPVEKKNELKEDIMIDKIIKENVHDKVKVQPKLLRQYYNDNIEEFHQKKEVQIRHIMVKFSAHNNNKEETYSLAKKIMHFIQKGEDFSNLAKLYSDGPNAEKGGLWSFEEVNELRKDLRDVACNLKDNECSKINESPVGYHIFKMELIKPEKTQEFETVQDEIYKKLYREEIGRLKSRYISSLKKGVFIQVVN